MNASRPLIEVQEVQIQSAGIDCRDVSLLHEVPHLFVR